MIEIEIPGLPISQPRQRHRAVGKFVQNYTPGNHPVQTFKAACRLVASTKINRPIVGAVAVEMEFYFPRPGTKVWKTKPMPKEAKVTKPDLDNLEKAVLDALKGVCWNDDAQVAKLASAKWIVAGGESPRCVIRIQEI